MSPRSSIDRSGRTDLEPRAHVAAKDVLLLDSDDRREFARLRAGDATAFENAFRSHYENLCRFARRYVGSLAVAEELVDDVFTKLWVDRSHLPTKGSIRNYLFVATRNRAISALRHEIVERNYTTAETSRGESQQAVVENEAERDVDFAEVRRAVRETLDELPERCRLALTLRWEWQMSRAEIAHVMGISIKTLEIYLTRGGKALRAKYRELYGE